MALELPTTNGAWQYGRVQYAKRSKKKIKKFRQIDSDCAKFIYIFKFRT